MERSGFFPYTEGDANSSYTAAFLAQYIASFIGNGAYASELGVTPGAGLSVSIAPGRGWINGYYYRTDAPVSVALQVASGSQPRRDNICLRLDVPNRAITLVAVRGTASSNPAPPALTRTTDIWDLKLAEVLIPAGATSISAANIQDTRLDKTVCGIVTGVVDQMDTTAFLNQMQSQFNAWMASIQGALDGDTAGNLLGLIQGLDESLDDHTTDTSNPHGVTAAQAGAVPTSRTVNGKALSGNISLAAADVGAAPASHASDKNNPHAVTAAQAGAVPTARTVNGKELSSNISLTATDVGAVPLGRSINGKTLTNNVTLTPSDISAVPVSLYITDLESTRNALREGDAFVSSTAASALNAHASSMNNPHNVTAEQIGALAAGQSTLYGSTVPTTLAPGRIFVKI